MFSKSSVDSDWNAVDNSLKIFSGIVLSNTATPFGPFTVDSSTVLPSTVVSRTVVPLPSFLLWLDLLSLLCFHILLRYNLLSFPGLVPPSIGVEILSNPGACIPLASPFTRLVVAHEQNFLHLGRNSVVVLSLEIDALYLQFLGF